MRKLFRAMVAASAIALALAGCGSSGGSAGAAAPTNVNPSGKIVPRQISWLLSRNADDPVVKTMAAIAAEYGQLHPGFSLRLITTPDRPSYIQKYETLAAANRLPELFDTDATPFAEKLAKQGKMINVEDLLKTIGLYSDYRANALNYQRFDDGTLYMVPLEYQAEFFWYNKALLAKAGVSVPTSLSQIPAMCTALRNKGITPIALDGTDQWPLERYISYQPFRVGGPGYVRQLKTGKTTLAAPAGQAAVNWIAALGKAHCFETGFSSAGYSDAQNLFTSGQAAMYNIGTWELSSLATTSLNSAVRSNINFFTLPTVSDSKTSANEYVVTSGIGVAVNAKTFDPLMRDFLKFALTRYYKMYAQSGALSPTTNVTTTVPADATSLYKKAIADANGVGPALAMPWDTQLDPTTNTTLQQDLVLLAQGNMSPSAFASTIDSAIAANAPKYFK